MPHATQPAAADRLRLGVRAWPLFTGAKIAGAVGLAASLLLGYLADHSFRRFYFAYLVAFGFFLSIALGALVFVLLQHVTKSGWSVTVRRTAESLAATLPVLAALSAPILISVALQKGDLYRWALPMSAAAPAHEQTANKVAGPAPAREIEHTTTIEAGSLQSTAERDPAAAAAAGERVLDALTLKKRAWLNPAFFIARVLAYFACWSLLARWYWRQSTLQDQTRDPELTVRMQRLSAPALVLVGVTGTLASFDLFMSLDPHWYSTIFGAYFFAGAFVGAFAALILATVLLQRGGFLRGSVTTEHYHDLGKFLFGFVFFWGYIAFSQYMLLWYSNIPEETSWLRRHGATTVSHDVTGWSLLAVAILIGHLLIPFAALMSRHVKRRPVLLAFWAVWLLVFHYLDLYWVVMPETGGALRFGLVDVAALIGVGGVFTAALVRIAASHDLRPSADPRLPEALAFQNV